MASIVCRFESCPRYQVKRPSEDTPRAVFIGFGNTFGNEPGGSRGARRTRRLVVLLGIVVLDKAASLSVYGTLQIGRGDLVVRVLGSSAPTPGKTIRAVAAADRLHFFATSGTRLRSTP